MKRVAIVGAGGFAREVSWLIQDINTARLEFEVVCHLVSDLSTFNDPFAKDMVVRDFDWYRDHHAELDGLVMGVGSPSSKARLVDQLEQLSPGKDWPRLVHPSVLMDEATAKLERGVVICAGTLATVNVTLRAFAMVNLGCTLGHEVVIGMHTVLNPSVNISGGVTLGNGVMVGTGAQVLQYLTVGDDAVIGAGAVVVKAVPRGTTVVGIPAKEV